MGPALVQARPKKSNHTHYEADRRHAKQEQRLSMAPPSLTEAL